jgi:hypothetical protein
MTNELQSLLYQYGLLYITMSKLEGDRPGRVHDTLDQYDASLGSITDDEPVVLVRVSDEGEPCIVTGDMASNVEERYQRANVTVMELPADEFHFFRAFRGGLFELDRVLPSFLFEMALVYAYTLFESYLFEVVRRRYRSHPELMGANKQLIYSDVLQSTSKEDLMETIIGREVDRLMYQPLVAVLDALRSRLGFRSLSTDLDPEIQILSMTRNCIVHNRSRVDPKLAALKPWLTVGQQIAANFASFSNALGTCRKLCAAIDATLEQIEQHK